MRTTRLKVPGITANKVAQVNVGHELFGWGFPHAESRAECFLSESFL
jgi:hypothetical protein